MRREHRNRWIMAGVLVLVGLLASATLLLSDEGVTVMNPKQTPSTEFSRPRLVGWSKGQRQWSLEARTMNDADDVVTLEKIENGIIYRNERSFLTFEAGKAVWYKKVDGRDSANLVLYEGVTVFEDGQLVMETSRLEWQEDDRLLIAPEAVYFIYDGSQARASRLILNSVTEDVVLEGEIDLSLRDGTLILVQGRLTYNMKTGSFRVEGMQQFDIQT
ncbi:MAG: hypothetical protein GX162_04425 [Firmicutes bacterium]|nr:hypothetical protein [Bacillota bacterium]